MGRYRERGLLGRLRGGDRAAMRKRRRAARHQPASPSGASATSAAGQQQRVRIAQVLAGEPDVIMLDEPVTGLDIPSQERILDVIEDYSSRGAVVIITTHHLDEARHCDSVVLHGQPSGRRGHRPGRYSPRSGCVRRSATGCSGTTPTTTINTTSSCWTTTAITATGMTTMGTTTTGPVTVTVTVRVTDHSHRDHSYDHGHHGHQDSRTPRPLETTRHDESCSAGCGRHRCRTGRGGRSHQGCPRRCPGDGLREGVARSGQGVRRRADSPGCGRPQRTRHRPRRRASHRRPADDRGQLQA